MLPNLLIALVLLFCIHYGIKWMARAQPAAIKRAMRGAGGLAALGVAALLALRGRLDMAAIAAGLGAWLMGWAAMPDWAEKFGIGKKPGAENVSRVRSAMIEMELDHGTGTMDGRVLAGSFDGARLSALTRPQGDVLYAEALRDDPEGARLLETYLDRRFPGWGAAGEADANPGTGGSGGRGRRNTVEMGENEAYQVLGLQQGATREDITRAHHALMKKLHPDHGGTTALAARVNEAKDVLMRRHL